MVHAVAFASSSTSSGTSLLQLGTAVLPEIIEALDNNIRDDLQSFAHELFVWGMVCTIFVGIGVLMEGPEILHELWPKIFTRFTWQSHERLARFERTVKQIAFVGWFVIGVGVLGEGVFGLLQDRAEGQLQTFNDILLKDARFTATTASRAAKAASAAAASAIDSSATALELSQGARKEADSFEDRIASANRKAVLAEQQAAEAESHLANALERAANAEERTAKAEAEIVRLKSPRSLTQLETLVSALRQYKGTEYVLNTFADQESMHLTVEIGKALKQAGWVRKQPPVMNIGIPTMSMIFEGDVKEMVPSCVDTGVSINAHTKESLADLNSKPLQSAPMTVQAGMALRNALPAAIVPQADGNVAVGIIDPTPGEGPMTICVGKKPL
jgi:hypothetical protein